MCRFDCIVTGRPNPELLWYREGVQVFEDSLHKIVINEDGINSLIFDATHKKDAGLYTCIARNRGGEDRFQVRLNVAREFLCALLSLPLISLSFSTTNQCPSQILGPFAEQNGSRRRACVF